MSKKRLISKSKKRKSTPPQLAKQVVSYYQHPDIISDNLDHEFKIAKIEGSDNYKPKMRQGVKTTTLPSHLEGYMKKRAMSASSTSVMSNFHSPFRIRPSVEQPTKRKDRNEWYRYYYKYDPIVHTAINTHATFPLSRFKVEHDDPEFADFLNEMVDEINLHDFMVRMGSEYYIVGEAIPFGFLDDPENPTRWKQFILLDPDSVSLNTHKFAWSGGTPYTIELEPDKDLVKIVENGPSDSRTGELYRNIPQDILELVRRKQNIKLPQLQVSHFKREVNYFQARGESVLSCVLADLMYLDKLREGQWNIVDRHISPKEFIFVGEPDNPATQAEIDNVQQLLQLQYNSPNQALIFHHAVRYQMEGAGGRVLPLQPEFDMVTKRLYAGLGINEAMITSQGPSFASSSVAMDIMVGRYEEFRKGMEQWLIHSVFKPLCKIHGIYKKNNEKNKRFRRFSNIKVPDLPRVVWDKAQLRDEMMKIQLVHKLVSEGVVPRNELLKLLNFSPIQMRKGFIQQAKDDLEDVQKLNQIKSGLGMDSPAPGLPNMGGPGGGLGPGGGMPGALPGAGGGPGGGMPGGLPGMGGRQPGPGGGGGPSGGGGSTPSPMGGGSMQRPPDSNRATQF